MMTKTSQRHTPIRSIKAFIGACVRPPKFDSSQGVSLLGVVGLSALYASGYFLPLFTPVRAYLLPSNDLFRLIVLPSLVAAATVGTMTYLGSRIASRWCSPKACAVGAYFVVSILTLIGLNGILEAAGYQWQDLIPLGRNLLDTERFFKDSALCGVMGLVWTLRDSLSRVSRLLSSLGFAFAILAAVRMALLVWGNTHAPTAVQAPSMQSTPVDLQGPGTPHSLPVSRSRRVVWIIFDELDYRRIFPNREPGLDLPHFDWLERRAVHATNANSPAGATLYSLPSLLTGTPLGGAGVHIAKPASLVIEKPDATNMRFSQENTIFGRLESSARTVSIMGFYHPYCKLFRVQRCDSFSYYELGGIWTALWANVPDRILARIIGGNWMQRITARSLRMLPEFLARDDDLTFVHLNVPHLPASYADKLFRLPETERGELEYSRNLRLTDEILGTIISDLQSQASRHELLLVISTDHWFRNIWYQPDVQETVRPVPFMAWRVGETEGVSMSEPVSTVNTAAMVEEFLQGTVDSQASIANWWARQPFYPSLLIGR